MMKTSDRLLHAMNGVRDLNWTQLPGALDVWNALHARRVWALAAEQLAEREAR